MTIVWWKNGGLSIHDDGKAMVNGVGTTHKTMLFSGEVVDLNPQPSSISPQFVVSSLWVVWGTSCLWTRIDTANLKAPVASKSEASCQLHFL